MLYVIYYILYVICYMLYIIYIYIIYIYIITLQNSPKQIKIVAIVMHYHTFWLGKWWSSRWHFGVMTILGTNLNGTWPNEPRWTVQLHLWIDLSAKNLWHWNFNSNGAAKEWRNGPGSQWISGLLSEFKLPTDSPFDYIHHVTSCYIYCNYLYLIYIWSIFVFYFYLLCILCILCVFVHPYPTPSWLPNRNAEAQREVWAWCPDLQGVSDLWR